MPSSILQQIEACVSKGDIDGAARVIEQAMKKQRPASAFLHAAIEWASVDTYLADIVNECFPGPAFNNDLGAFFQTIPAPLRQAEMDLYNAHFGDGEFTL